MSNRGLQVTSTFTVSMERGDLHLPTSNLVQNIKDRKLCIITKSVTTPSFGRGIIENTLGRYRLKLVPFRIHILDLATDIERRNICSIIITPYVMVSSAMELQLWVFRFLPTTHMETNANKMRPQSSRAVWRFEHIYLHALDRSRYAPDESWQEKPDWSSVAKIKMAQVLGSPVYICGHTFKNTKYSKSTVN